MNIYPEWQQRGHTCTYCGGDHRVCGGKHPGTPFDWSIVLPIISFACVLVAIGSAIMAVTAR